QPEFACATHVVDRRDRLTCLFAGSAEGLFRGRLAGQRIAHFFGIQWRWRDGPEADPGRNDILAGRVEHDAGSDTHDGDIHLVARDETPVMRTGVCCGLGESKLDEQLAGLEDVLAWTRAELLDRD